MTTLYGSPKKSEQIASRMEKYMKSLNTDEQTVLKPLSPSRINSARNLNEIVNGSPSSKKNFSISSPDRECANSKGSPNLKSPSNSVFFHSPSKEDERIKSLVNTSSKFKGKEKDYYEFLCRVAEAKQWIEAIIEESLPSVIELVTTKCMSDGVYLAKLVRKIKPDLVTKIVPAGNSLLYAHTQNINVFFDLADYLEVPNLFRFELTDLYERKDMPKVFETIHAVASLLSNKFDDRLPQMQNRTGDLDISSEDIKICQRKIPNLHAFRPFKHNNSRNSSPLKASSKYVSEKAKKQNELKCDDSVFSMETPKTPQKHSSHTSHQTASTHASPVADVVLPSHLSNIPQLQPSIRLTYSPDRTFSYYSPGISRNLSYRTEEVGYFNRRRAQNSYDYDYYDTFRYSRSNYSPIRRQRMSESEFLDTVTIFQSILRGLNVRYNIHLKNLTLEQKHLKCDELKSLCKGMLSRKKVEKTKFLSSQYSFTELQSVLLGCLVRQKCDYLRFRCLKNERQVAKLQNFAKSAALRSIVRRNLQFNTTYDLVLSRLQTKIRGNKVRSLISEKSSRLNTVTFELISLQAIMRGKLVRTFAVLSSKDEKTVFLQALLKGVIQRRNILSLFQIIDSSVVQEFSGYVRGYIVSQKYAKCIGELPPQISQFNAIAKGVLTRFAIELINDVVENNKVSALQAIVAGHLVRRQVASEENYYESNLSSIIVVQKHIRRYQTQNAYKELMSCACPSLASIKKFVHVLNNSDSDVFSTQLQRIKKKINETNDEFNEIEEELEILIRKKASLEKRRINVSKHLSSAGRKQLQGRTISIGHPTISKNLLILYSKVGFLLQVDPFYWKLLSHEDPQFCAANLPKIYSPVKGNIKIREQLLFTRVIGELMVEQIHGNLTENTFFGKRNSVWSTLLQDYLISFKAEALNHSFSQLYKYIDSDAVTFESDPTIIHRKIHPNSAQLPAHVAIVDPDTSVQYVKNMTALWTAVEIVCAIVDEQSHRNVSELKYLCSEAYQRASSVYGDEFVSLKAIGNVILNSFLNVALEKRNEITSTTTHEHYKSKVSTLMKTLDVVFGFKQFTGYFEPLNTYLEQSQDNIVSTLRSLLIEPDERKTYENVIFDDMANESRPSFVIYHQNFIKIIRKFTSVMPNIPHDDPILGLLHSIELEYDKNSVSGQSQLVFSLDPTVYRVPITDDRSTMLYHEAKVGICCCIQIEDACTSLTELLLSEILPEDEEAFKSLLKKYNGIERQLHQHGGSMSYRELKRFLLHRIKELTALEIIDKSNDYQFILADIANSIKCNSCIKDLNDKEIKLMESVYGFLQNKYQSLQYLKEALQQASLRSIADLQSKRKTGTVKKNGLGNKLKDAYQRTQHKNSEGSGLALKWSIRQLVEAEVVVKMGGESLRNNNVSFFGSSGSKYPDINVKISTKDGEIFGFEMLDNRKKNLNSLHTVLKFSELIEKEGLDPQAQISIFEGKPMILRVDKLLDLLVNSYFSV